MVYYGRNNNNNYIAYSGKFPNKSNTSGSRSSQPRFKSGKEQRSYTSMHLFLLLF